VEYIDNSMVDLPNSILPTQEGFRLKRAAMRGGVAAGKTAAERVMQPGWLDLINELATRAINDVLNTLTGENSRFGTEGLYSAADVIDFGDDNTYQERVAYQRAVEGFVTEAAGNGFSFLIPNAIRTRSTPAIGSEVLWNHGAFAQPAPNGAPTIWLVAANQYVRNNPNPVGGDPSNSRCLGFIIRFNGFYYYTGGDLEVDSEDLIADDILAHPLPNPQGGGNFPLTNHICAFKCGHHGSRTATSNYFVGTIHPRATIISTGGTRFEHPDQDVITRLHLSPDIQFFYLTNCNFQTTHVPASDGINQLTAVGNKSRVAGDNRVWAKMRYGDIVVHVDENESHLGGNHGFRVTYWDDDDNNELGMIRTQAHNH
jgi:hypothetical protein